MENRIKYDELTTASSDYRRRTRIKQNEIESFREIVSWTCTGLMRARMNSVSVFSPRSSTSAKPFIDAEAVNFVATTTLRCAALSPDSITYTQLYSPSKAAKIKKKQRSDGMATLLPVSRIRSSCLLSCGRILHKKCYDNVVCSRNCR